MDPTIRGMIEQTIDHAISIKALTAKLMIFEKYRDEGMLDSPNSALFGNIYTEAFDTYISSIVRIGQEVTQEDLEAFEKIIEARGAQIRSRINEVANR